MGHSQSSTSGVLVIDTTNTMNMLTQNIQTLSQKISVVATNVQNLNVSCKGCNISGGITTSQSISSQNQVSGTLDASSNAQVFSNLASSLQAAIDQSASSKSGVAALGSSSSSTSNYTKLKSATTTNLTTQNLTDSYAKIVATTVNLQDQKINLDGSLISGGVNLSQIIISNVLAQSMIKSTIDSINKSLQSSGSTVQLSQTAAATSSGLEALFTTQNVAISGVVCCICFCCIALILYELIGTGGQIIKENPELLAA